MNKQEAIEALNNGEQLTHTIFTKEEWIIKIGENIVDEGGYLCHSDLFWADREEEYWNEGWSIVGNIKGANLINL